LSDMRFSFIGREDSHVLLGLLDASGKQQSKSTKS
jgi:hypothetical protein